MYIVIFIHKAIFGVWGTRYYIDTAFSFDKVVDLSFSLSLYNASPGIDNIPMSLFSGIMDVLADIIFFICNKTVEQRVFLERLAIVIIVSFVWFCIICMFFKKGNINVMGNYGTISLLVAFSKTLKKLVSTR